MVSLPLQQQLLCYYRQPATALGNIIPVAAAPAATPKRKTMTSWYNDTGEQPDLMANDYEIPLLGAFLFYFVQVYCT